MAIGLALAGQKHYISSAFLRYQLLNTFFTLPVLVTGNGSTLWFAFLDRR